MNKIKLPFKYNSIPSCLRALTRSLTTGSLYHKVFSHDIRGIFPAVPTPFDRNGQIYYPGLLENFVVWNQIPQPLNGYLVQGSNGECAFLNAEERVELVREAKRLCMDKILIAGSGCESTQATIELSNQMADNGADVALVLTPFHYKQQMSSSVLLRHFEDIADGIKVPLIMYSCHANSRIDIPYDVVKIMSQHSNCIGIKDSGADVHRIAQLANITSDCEFSVMTGSAAILLPCYLAGAAGAIAGLVNILGEEICELYKCCERGDFVNAAILQRRLIEPNNMLSRKYGVAGMKATLDWIGMYGGYPRSPLVPLKNADMEVIKEAFYSKGFFLNKT